jgi:hypothetical protein
MTGLFIQKMILKFIKGVSDPFFVALQAAGLRPLPYYITPVNNLSRQTFKKTAQNFFPFF